MKKTLFLFFTVLTAILINPSPLDAKPIWVKIKIGFFAKWSITLNGECEDGKGICLAFGDNADPNSNLTFLGYDEESNKFCLKISKQWPPAKSLSYGTYEMLEDSPIDPKATANLSNFKDNGKIVILKKGTYKVKDDGDFYLISFEYQIL